MAPFRWPELSHDVALATEVAARRPQKPQDWEDIAQALSQAFSTPGKQVQLKAEDAVKEWIFCSRSIKMRMLKP